MTIKERLAKLNESFAKIADDFKAWAVKYKKQIATALAGVGIFAVGYALGKEKGEDCGEFIENHPELNSACKIAGAETTFPICDESGKNPSTTTVLKALVKGLTGKEDVSDIVSDWDEDPTSTIAVTIWSKKE